MALPATLHLLRRLCALAPRAPLSLFSCIRLCIRVCIRAAVGAARHACAAGPRGRGRPPPPSPAALVVGSFFTLATCTFCYQMLGRLAGNSQEALCYRVPPPPWLSVVSSIVHATATAAVLIDPAIKTRTQARRRGGLIAFLFSWAWSPAHGPATPARPYTAARSARARACKERHPVPKCSTDLHCLCFKDAALGPRPCRSGPSCCTCCPRAAPLAPAFHPRFSPAPRRAATPAGRHRPGLAHARGRVHVSAARPQLPVPSHAAGGADAEHCAIHVRVLGSLLAMRSAERAWSRLSDMHCPVVP
jgi:hypothetical protein